jgi:hypothetical protein
MRVRASICARSVAGRDSAAANECAERAAASAVARVVGALRHNEADA